MSLEHSLTLFGFILILSLCLLQTFISFKIFHKLKGFQKLKESNIVDGNKETKLIKEQLKEEVLTALLLKMYTIRNTVQKQTTNIHVKSIELAPKSASLEEELLKNYLPSDKILILDSYWKLFNTYITQYWMIKNGNLKTVFTGEVDKKSGDVGKMIHASEQLVIKLDQLLEEFQR